MLNNFFNSIEITPNHVKIFIFTFVAMLVMVFLQRIGVHSPLPVHALSLLDK